MKCNNHHDDNDDGNVAQNKVVAEEVHNDAAQVHRNTVHIHNTVEVFHKFLEAVDNDDEAHSNTFFYLII